MSTDSVLFSYSSVVSKIHFRSLGTYQLGMLFLTIQSLQLINYQLCHGFYRDTIRNYYRSNQCFAIFFQYNTSNWNIEQNYI